jgi:hypothetical protein
MRKALGYGIIVDPAQCQPVEHDTFTCCHCSKVVPKAPYDPMGDKVLAARCTCCDALMCKECIGKGCRPVEKWLDQYEARNRFRAELCA